MLVTVLLSSGHVGIAQERGGEGQEPTRTQTDLIDILGKLRTPNTDWLLLQDTCDRLRAGGEETARLVLEEIGNDNDPMDVVQAKYRVRLARVLAEIDPNRGLPLLAELCAVENPEVAALA